MVPLSIHIVGMFVVLVGLCLPFITLSILGVRPSLVGLRAVLSLLLPRSHVVVESLLVFVRENGVSSGD